MLPAMTIDAASTAREIASAVSAGEATAADVVAASLQRCETVQEATNAFVTIAHDAARAAAARVDARLAAGEELPLAGVPVAVKDNICTAEIRSTAGSEMLGDFVPPYDATVVARLEAAGAVVVAKANCDEFGMGGSNENSAFGPVRNPWDAARVSGGSSGGSAVAVAAGAVPVALGTDTGGSVRQPAAFTGVLGFKPTYGTFSRYGVMAFASSLDQVGVLARSVDDVAAVGRAVAGLDPMDATTVEGRPETWALPTLDPDGDAPLAGLRIGRVEELSGDGVAADVRAGLDRTLATLEAMGATIVDVHLPRAEYGVATYYLVAMAEASSNLARYDGMIYSTRLGEDGDGQADVMMRSRGASFGPEVRRRVLMGTYALSAGYYDAYYGRALKARRRIAEDFDAAFAEVDVVASPTAPTTAYRLGAKVDDPLAMYLGDIATCLANLAGLGGLSVPAGRDADGLPIGVQFVAPAGEDARTLRVAAALEQRAGRDAFAPLAGGR